MRFGLMGLVMLGVVGTGTAASAADYDIDTRQSLLTVKTFKDGIAARLAHDHIIQATEFGGTLSFDPAAADGHSISVDAKTATLKVDDLALRKRVGLPGGPDESEREKIAKEMHAEDQLHTSKYPTMSFKSSGIKKQADGTYLVNGKLTIRGKTNDVSFPAKVSLQGANVHASGSLKFNQSTFGYSPYSGVFGTVKNKDEVVLTVDLVATPKPGATPVAAVPAAAGTEAVPAAGALAPASTPAPTTKK